MGPDHQILLFRFLLSVTCWGKEENEIEEKEMKSVWIQRIGIIMCEEWRILLTMERLELSTELEDVIGTAERAREKREQRQPGPS